MDSFIDKSAQRKNAQEMIRANAMAEAREREKLTQKLSEYELIMQEMRRCNLNNLESSEKVKELLAESLHKIAEAQKQNDVKSDKSVEELRVFLERLAEQMTKFAQDQQERMAEFTEEQHRLITEMLEKQQSRMDELAGQQAAQMKTIEELLHASDEFGHKEAVKVYRNVQAVIEGALPKQTEEIKSAIKNAAENKKKATGMTVLWVLTFAAAAANVVINVLKIMGYL